MVDSGANKNFFESINEKCRTCLASGAEFNLTSNCVEVGDGSLSLAELILMCASVQVSKHDGFSQRICEKCKDAAIKSHLFKLQCESSDKFWKSTVQCNQSPKDSTNFHKDDSKNMRYDETIKIKVEDVDFFLHEDESQENHGSDLTGDEEDLTQNEIETKNFTADQKQHGDLKKRTCSHCDKIFQYRTSMLRHAKQHNAAPKTCPFCSFQPSTPNILSKHMEEMHAHLKTFTCSVCDKSFFKKNNLRIHVQMHTGVRQHTCEVCGLSFVLRGNLQVHRRVHTGEKPYTCSACGRGFTQQSALRSHEAVHSDRRDHVCQECGAAFNRAGALRNHQKRHLATKSHECSICGKKFTFSAERKRHMIIHSGDRHYMCEVCGRRFSRNTHLKVHRRIHTGETPHVCEVCGKGFIQAHCLKTHLNTHERKPNTSAKV